jgi:predicted Zn-dependent peptidase
MVDEMERIVQDGISQEELSFAQQSMRGNFLRSFETPSQVGGRLQAIFAYDLPGDYYRTYLDRLAALTLEGIHRVAQHWLIPDRMAIVVVGDRSGLKDQLRKAEFGDIVDYSDF